MSGPGMKRIGPFALLSFLVAVAQPSLGQPAEPAPPSCDNKENVSWDQWMQGPAVAELATAELVATQPLETPASKQTTAVSDPASSTSPVQGADIPTLLALAAERGLASTSDGKITLNLSPFDVLVALDSRVRDQQTRYEQHATARRFGLAVTLGGKGESFDRDGDGTADPALEAADLGDIVGWEARYRLAGSRDRRDRANYTEFFNDLASTFARQTDAFSFLHNQVTQLLRKRPLVSETNSQCFSRAGLDALLNEPAVRDSVLALLRADRELVSTTKVALEKIDSRAVWTLVVGGVERKDDFGPDKRMAAIRGAIGGPNRNFTLNLEWNETDNPGGTNPTMWKGGLEYAVLVLRGSELSTAGIKVAGSGVYEKYDHVPSAKHDSVARLNAKMELPIADGVKIPISVTWANHHDLIEGESEIRGHIGFTIDLAEARKHFLARNAAN